MRFAKEVAAFVLSFVLIGPAPAQDDIQNLSSSSDAAGAQKVLLEAAKDLHNLRSNPRFADLLQKAKGVLIVPYNVKGSLAFGGSGGTGVLVAHANGQWSNPAFVTIGSFSFGLQFGWYAGPLFLFAMTDKALADLTKTSNIYFWGNAGVVLYSWAPNAHWPISEGGLVVWTGENGVFGGLFVGGSDTHDKTVYNKAYYNNKYTDAKQIIGSRGDPDASPLLNEFPG